jgi:hypothetical protein
LKKTLTYFIIIPIIIMSCTKQNKPIRQYTYTVRINVTELNIDGSRLVPEIKEDTIRAENDTVAYEGGLITYIASKTTNEKFKGKMGTTKGYQIIDSLGNDLDISLSKNVIDSLKQQYKKHLKPNY